MEARLALTCPHFPYPAVDSHVYGINAEMANDPVLIAYSVQDRTATRPARWTRLGVAFPHERGAGLTVFINAPPLDFDGRVVLVEPSANYDDIRPAGPHLGR